jgi:membrane protein YqaA with SNARE-associated domain
MGRAGPVQAFLSAPDPTMYGAVPDPSPEPSPDAARYRVDWTLIVKANVGLVVLLGISYLCGMAFRDPIITAGEWALDHFGLVGIAVGTVFTDSSPLPMTNEPLALLALSAGRTANTVFVVIACASVFAGFVGHTAGRLVGSRTAVGPWLRRRYPGFQAFMEDWGALGVAICAFLPIPFALSTWTAGMTQVPLHKVMVASLVRIPKTAFYVWLIAQGWNAGAS